jgi:hypothetical protein
MPGSPSGVAMRVRGTDTAGHLRPWLLRTGCPALLIGVVFLVMRWWLARSPGLSETYYDEALTGLMSLAILRGLPQVFYWGQPYLGAEDAYLVAGGFALFGASTFVLRMTVATVAVGWAWASWGLARRVVGDPWGLVAGIFVAVPPIFLSYIQLSSHGETVSLTLGCLTLLAAAALMDVDLGGWRRGAAWVALGLAGGLGWWASQMMGMFLFAGAVTLLVARPRVLRSPGPYVAFGVFLLASAPFWIWNARHEWATFWHLATWGGPLPSGLSARVQSLAWPLLATFHNHFWDGRAVVLPSPVERVWWGVVWVFYAPALAVAVMQVGRWAIRLARQSRPWREPIDLVVLAFWLTVGAHLVTWFGTSGVLRYSMTFYATVPVLGAVALGRLARWGRPGTMLAAGLVAFVLAYNLITNLAFVEGSAGDPARPVDAAIQRMEALGLRACYADSRIAQVLAFESRERVECADFHGLRNYAFLRAVDAVDDPAQVAIVTHRVLQGPAPDHMARMLELMGARSRQESVGQYVIFHHIVPPDPPVRSIPPVGWRASASSSAGTAERAFDRRVWTWWKAPKLDGEWYQVDLGAPRSLAQFDLLVAPEAVDAPLGIRVETSLDAHDWERVADMPDLIPGFHWWKGHPRMDDSGRVLVRFAPHPVRYVRIIHLGTGAPNTEWGIGELFVYEAADRPWSPPAPAVAALAEARAEIDHFMDDPGGPNPRRSPVTYPHRRAQVAWARAFNAADRALTLAPEWEEAHHLYGTALITAGWASDPDEMVVRARKDGAWWEVVRWAGLAESVSPPFWRSGRDDAIAEARRQLGGAAAGMVVERPPLPTRRVSARFGREIELMGVDLPSQVHPGETVEVRYHWRALSRLPEDYWAFVHVQGPGHELNQDHVLGRPTFGTSHWEAGEEASVAVPLVMPPDARPGPYRIRVGVWLPETGKRLRVTETDLPHAPRSVDIGAMTVVTADQTARVTLPTR